MKHSIRCDLFPGGRRKAVTLSYDDGTQHDRRFVEILDRYGLKGSFHLNSSSLGRDGFLEPGEIATLFRHHEVSAHSVSHPHLSQLPPGMLGGELLDDRRALEALCGYPVRGMSYPFGTYSDSVVAVLPGYGIEYARTVESHGRFDLPEDFLRWHPTCHHLHALEEKTAQFLDAPDGGRLRLLYVWGHSYEFANDDNWELIERFGARIAATRDEVWLATNIEIFDYCAALQALRVSVDGSSAHNRSHLSLWLSIDGEPREMGPGERLVLD